MVQSVIPRSRLAQYAIIVLFSSSEDYSTGFSSSEAYSEGFTSESSPYPKTRKNTLFSEKPLERLEDKLSRLFSFSVSDSDFTPPSATVIATAVKFACVLQATFKTLPLPEISLSDDGEIVLRWRKNDKRISVGFEKENEFGYTMFKGGRFVAGAEEGNTSKTLPQDLQRYFQALIDDKLR
jgi:hypothetical protein